MQLQSEWLSEMGQLIICEPGQWGCLFLRSLAQSAAEQKPERK